MLRLSRMRNNIYVDRAVTGSCTCVMKQLRRKLMEARVCKMKRVPHQSVQPVCAPSCQKFKIAKRKAFKDRPAWADVHSRLVCKPAGSK